MRQLLNQCLVIFRREQQPVLLAVKQLTPEQYMAAVAKVAKQLKAIL